MKQRASQPTLDFEAKKPADQRGILDYPVLEGARYGDRILDVFGAAVGSGSPLDALVQELRRMDGKGIVLQPALADFARQVIHRYTGAETGFRLYGEGGEAAPAADQLWKDFANALTKNFQPAIAGSARNLLPGFFAGLKSAAEHSEALGGTEWDAVLEVAFREYEAERKRWDAHVQTSPRLDAGDYSAMIESLTAIVGALSPGEQQSRWAQKLPTVARERILGD